MFYGRKYKIEILQNHTMPFTIRKLLIFYFSLKNWIKVLNQALVELKKKFKQNLIFGSSMWAQYSNG